MINDNTAYNEESFDAELSGVPDDGTNIACNKYDLTPTDSSVLIAFMDNEASGLVYYRALAEKTSGYAKQLFEKLAVQERSHLQKLRAAFFILTGRSYAAIPDTPKITTLSEALRNRYMSEMSAYDAYISGVRDTSRGDLASLYNVLAAEKRQQADLILDMIQKYMV